VTGHVGVTSL